MDSLPKFLRDIESPAFWRTLAPWLHVEGPESDPASSSPSPHSPPPPSSPSPHPPPLSPSPPSPLAPPRGSDRLAGGAFTARRWPASGYLELGAILDRAASVALARAVSALHARGLHPTFLYVFDEAWHVVEALRPHLAPFLGADLDVLADVWAWHIDPRTERGGWPIHRGVYEDVRDEDGVPGLVNLWIALTDATVRNACMHMVPLPRDPHYPADLRNVQALEDLGIAVPTAAGSALAWNANVAHWGGACDPTFDRPRLSMSFTLSRRRSGTVGHSVRLPLAFRERLDIIADQFATYGDGELAPDRPEMRWSVVVEEMRMAAQRSAAARK